MSLGGSSANEANPRDESRGVFEDLFMLCLASVTVAATAGAVTLAAFGISLAAANWP